jgi:hypothetical protein
MGESGERFKFVKQSPSGQLINIKSCKKVVEEEDTATSGGYCLTATNNLTFAGRVT